MKQSCIAILLFNVFDPWCKTPDAPLQDELLCWTCFFYWLLLFYTNFTPPDSEYDS